MKEYFDKGIKAIIDQFPKVAEILDSYHIGCVPCQVGTCKLRDVIEIHNLTIEQEHELFAKISAVVFPGQEVEIPRLERKPVSLDKKLSPPLVKLIDEHKYIKRVIALVPSLAKLAQQDWAQAKPWLLDVVDFIKNYADRFHHAKEEDILFKYFDEKLEILQIMHHDHETGRSYVRGIMAGLNDDNQTEAIKNLQAYAELLLEHIRREDEVLYPWMDKNLTVSQVGEIFSRFALVESDLGHAGNKYEEFVVELEKQFKGGVAGIKK